MIYSLFLSHTHTLSTNDQIENSGVIEKEGGEREGEGRGGSRGEAGKSREHFETSHSNEAEHAIAIKSKLLVLFIEKSLLPDFFYSHTFEQAKFIEMTYLITLEG